jgi:hypothetical protein
MKSIDPKLRADAGKAESVITGIFRESRPSAMRNCLRFLHDSIEFLSSTHSDGWGITLFDDGFRLNVGWVEALVLRKNGLDVLVERELAPTGTTFRTDGYKWAPGCDLTRVPFSELRKTLPTLSEAHLSALSIAANRKTNKSIREAHSTGVTEYLSRFRKKQVSCPTYPIKAVPAETTARRFKRFLAQEGKLKKFILMKRERDPKVRANALAGRGAICEICRFDFAATYGEFARNCVEVHHLELLAGAGSKGVTTSLDDVLVVCPNCHRALHQFRDPGDWKAFQKACHLR